MKKINLVLTFIAILLVAISSIAQPDMQTLTLNTGFNHATQTTFAVGGGQKDDYWQLVSDPIASTTEPRLANTIPPYGSAWKPAMSNSTWLSYNLNGQQGIQQGDYVYRKCFCLKKGFDSKDALEKTKMNISVRADDAIFVHLNVIPTSSNYLLTNSASSGGFNSANPATLDIGGGKLFSMLKVGTNCLFAKVQDTGTVVTGFNLTGSITAAGIDEVAKFTDKNPNPQFSRCSSCSKGKFTDGNQVFDAASDVKFDIKAQPIKP
jgi:hypothetical protein